MARSSTSRSQISPSMLRTRASTARAPMRRSTSVTCDAASFAGPTASPASRRATSASPMKPSEPTTSTFIAQPSGQLRLHDHLVDGAKQGSTLAVEHFNAHAIAELHILGRGLALVHQLDAAPLGDAG